MTTNARGRPRDTSVDAALLRAAVELLAENGYGALTIEAVATRAGVGKPALYRRWSTKEELVVAALGAHVAPPRDTATGDARKDLRAMLGGLARHLSGPAGGAVFGVHVAADGNPELTEVLRERYLAPRAVVLTEIVRRGKADGQIRADASVDLVRDLVFGPPVYHQLITGNPMSTRRLSQTFDAAWRALSA
ncbi:TetR/AcrR family transcriptional regulator [Herbihabitans rhizosphaerae]|uniref:TetR/AcrR family transcriptional regulator n=1 Tax=Herbihabitans rhizosphaerae TaxID=1872711 RepID=UPI0013EE76C3|nr:TetR/AcrR family transcriptional regulator [Herbihabitans rhizosphaerae]